MNQCDNITPGVKPPRDNPTITLGLNPSRLISLARTDQDAKKVDLILNEVNPGASKSVPDPYYGHGDGFKLVFEMLSQACEIIVKRL